MCRWTKTKKPNKTRKEILTGHTHRVRNNAGAKSQVPFATMLDRRNELLQTKLENTEISRKLEEIIPPADKFSKLTYSGGLSSGSDNHRH